VIDYAIRIQAPASVVFEMLTDAELLTEWMAVEARSDPSPEGAFRWVYENGDVVAGRYVALEPPYRLVLAYGWELPVDRGIPPGSTEVEITLEEADGATLLRLIHHRLPPAQLEAHRDGWDFFLCRLAAWLADKHASEINMPDTTNQLVDDYYRAWGSGDFDGLGGLLTDDFRFRGPIDSADGPDAFVALIRRNAPLFGEVAFEDVRRVVDGERAVNLYDFVAGPARVPMAEAFEVRDGRIARIDLYFDPAPFRPPG